MKNPHEEKLLRLLDEGKITPTQFYEMRSALPPDLETTQAAETVESASPRPLDPRLLAALAPGAPRPGPRKPSIKLRLCSLLLVVVGIITANSEFKGASWAILAIGLGLFGLAQISSFFTRTPDTETEP